ncbi:site-2 protease family protein [Auritidibacter ignavus]|uniref:site-2 protease family protein n=1 Tax=Auritidibacter ignavus TaxID=678932 RepID=UPI0024BA530D|nr:site-2 protease family protein [Auritidibacter ignavus]WHS27929.1 site-2 protease family protein [Auritidibacter ignavus]
MSASSTTISEQGIVIARYGRTPIRLAWSWWIFATALLILIRPFFVILTPPTAPGWLPWLLSAFFVLGLLITVLCHELAHAIAARSFGWRVYEIRLTLWGGYTSFAEHDSNHPRTPMRSMVVALAGPAANILLALILTLVAELTGPHLPSPWLGLISVLTTGNWLIAAFNLLPGHPLDGGSVVETIGWKITGSKAQGLIAAGWSGRLIVAALIIGVVAVLILRGDQLPILLLVVVGVLVLMLWGAAGEGIKRGNALRRAEATVLAELAVAVILVSATTPVAQVIDKLQKYPAGYHDQPLIVQLSSSQETGPPRVTGLIDPATLAQVPTEFRHQTSAHEVSQAFTGSTHYVPADRRISELGSALATDPDQVFLLTPGSGTPASTSQLPAAAVLGSRIAVYLSTGR